MDKPSQPLRVLLVEDNPADAELVLRQLRRAGFEPDWQRVDTEPEFLGHLDPKLDVILSDYAMPQFSGLRALELAEERGLGIPFILVSGTIGEEIAVQAMRSGAADYLLKDRLARLGPAVSHALEQSWTRKERESAQEAMRQSEHKYRHLFESLSESAFLIDEKSRRVLDANLRAETLLGRRRSEILGMYESELFPPSRAAHYCKILSTPGVRAADVLDDAEIRSKDGTTVPVRVSVAPIELYGRNLALVLMADITERKRAEETLDRLRRQSELILNSAGEGIYGIDLNGDINFINPKAAELLGWKAQDLLGKPAHATIHYRKSDGSDYPIESCAIHTAIRAQGAQRVTNDVLWRKGGTSFRVDYVSAPIKDEHGEVRGCIVTFKDITEQFMAEARQKLQAEQYRLLFETNPNPMWVFDAKSLEILAVNKAAVTQYGYSHEEFLKLTLEDLRPPEDVPGLMTALTSPRSPTHFSGEFRHKKKDGSVIPVEIYSGPIIWSGVTARIVTAIDVTERKRAEERLREQAEMLDHANDAIIVRNFDDRRIVFWNSGAERLYGWTASEAISRTGAELIVANPQEMDSIWETLLSSGEFRGVLKEVTKDGRELIVDLWSTLIRNSDGTPRSVMSINKDITDQKNLEAQLLRVQRLESIGTLASGVAHDLNNVLTPILMCADMLRRNPNNPDAQASVSMIEQSARRGASIVKQVLTFARGVEGERGLIQPSHLIEELIDIARRTFPKSIDIKARYPKDLWPITADPTQLHQVLLNLAVNARDAMPNGGSIVISSENVNVDERHAAIASGAKVGPYLMLRISDTGTGMPRDVIDKMFDPFFTTKEVGKGTGLGLSTALGIVKSHDGLISVKSELGKGTTFEILLPAAPKDEALGNSGSATEPLRGKGQLILVVDDEPSILGVTKLILEGSNYGVIHANDGSEALTTFSQQKDKISLVLTDMMLPRMGGHALIRELKKIKPDTIFIASSGHDDDLRAPELEALGVTDFLMKPYDTQTLLTTVREALS